MRDFSIRLSISRLTKDNISYGNKFDKETMDSLIRAFAAYVSSIYLLSIDEQVNSNRYKGKWEPSEKEYKEYIGTDPLGDLLPLIEESLVITKRASNYHIEFSESVRYPGSKLKFVKVLRAIEYGTSKFSSRPLLRKISREIQRDIMILWKGFLTRKGVI